MSVKKIANTIYGANDPQSIEYIFRLYDKHMQMRTSEQSDEGTVDLTSMTTHNQYRNKTFKYNI